MSSIDGNGMRLINELYGHFNLSGKDVYRHPDVSYKNPDEAGSATWK